jgi:hypothetical protein
MSSRPPARHHVLQGCLEILSCPPPEAEGLAGEIRRRGNVPVCFGPGIVVELTAQDIKENWRSARALRRQVAGAMAAELGHRLRHCDEDEESVAHAGEAAACLFLSLHHEGIPLSEALQGCRILWDERHHREKVEYLS